MNDRFVIQDLGGENADLHAELARLRSIVKALRNEIGRADEWTHKQGRLGGTWECVPTQVLLDILDFENE